ncbi:PDGLE domain-containing protein [Planktothrix sp. FACHB-1355]|uniref:PDGLE domain-containing protein n=1 Tax=Aerosakkonema funiforme FACHB-1375 TaxID=2949571 RepID=A0A926VE29_9CYAN|nr:MULTISPECIES: PDGLE domain-containing protein [Oscillatoriales]MBD2182206.1 PDGLE domain-containing protein [Aerosakkonema funiforme FACHB-1375]MBD3561417.1 PDGLE domain-containing protein [Planktothrix sp. FACHB-1355]
MSSNIDRDRNRAFVIAGLGVALLIAIFVSPFASSDPDGLDRVSQELKFEDKAIEEAPAKKLPFYAIFEEYALRGVPEQVATPLAGLVGTLTTFGLAWGIGKLVVRNSAASLPNDTTPHPDKVDRSLD